MSKYNFNTFTNSFLEIISNKIRHLALVRNHNVYQADLATYRKYDQAVRNGLGEMLKLFRQSDAKIDKRNLSCSLDAAKFDDVTINKILTRLDANQEKLAQLTISPAEFDLYQQTFDLTDTISNKELEETAKTVYRFFALLDEYAEIVNSLQEPQWVFTHSIFYGQEQVNEDLYSNYLEKQADWDLQRFYNDTYRRPYCDKRGPYLASNRYHACLPDDQSDRSDLVLNKHNPFSDINIRNQVYLYPDEKGNYTRLSLNTNPQITDLQHQGQQLLAVVPNFNITKAPLAQRSISQMQAINPRLLQVATSQDQDGNSHRLYQLLRRTELTSQNQS